MIQVLIVEWYFVGLKLQILLFQWHLVGLKIQVLLVEWYSVGLKIQMVLVQWYRVGLKIQVPFVKWYRVGQKSVNAKESKKASIFNMKVKSHLQLEKITKEKVEDKCQRKNKSVCNIYFKNYLYIQNGNQCPVLRLFIAVSSLETNLKAKCMEKHYIKQLPWQVLWILQVFGLSHEANISYRLALREETTQGPQ